MSVTKASEAQIKAFLSQYDRWSVKDKKLHREFVFEDFIQAFGFMTEVALHAQSSNHHPEWSNVYKRVVVNLTTHEAGGITDKDFKLAQQMDRIAAHSQVSVLN